MTPTLIEGIYNYCDRCCWRCRFAERCVCGREHAGHGDPPDDPARAVAATFVSTMHQATATIQQIAGQLGVELTPTRDEMEAVSRVHHRKVRSVREDRLVQRGTEYAMQAWPIARALRPILAAGGDHIASAAAERLEEITGTVASKIYRAVSNTYESDFDFDDRQSDANGSAKVARLLIEESRRAWRVLTEAGRATADGVPARLIAVLDDLEAGLMERFPRALEFIRPGFDTEDFDDLAGQLAAAVRQCETPQGHA